MQISSTLPELQVRQSLQGCQGASICRSDRGHDAKSSRSSGSIHGMALFNFHKRAVLTEPYNRPERPSWRMSFSPIT